MKSQDRYPTQLSTGLLSWPRFTSRLTSPVVKRALACAGLALALTGCDETQTQTSSHTAQVDAAEFGQIQAALQLSAEIDCHTFNLINDDEGDQELSIDLSSARLISGQYSFQRALRSGNYRLVGQLECSDAQQQPITYESFPQAVEIVANQASQVSFDFIFNRRNTLDTVNLQLCAEFMLSALSHGAQACVGDHIEASYNVQWIADPELCQDLDLQMTLNQELMVSQALTHGVDVVSISMNADQLTQAGLLEINLSDLEGNLISLYQQTLDVVSCSGEALLDPESPQDPEHQDDTTDNGQAESEDSGDQTSNTADQSEVINRFSALSESPYMVCEGQSTRLTLLTPTAGSVMSEVETYNIDGRLTTRSVDSTSGTNLSEFSYDVEGRLLTTSHTHQAPDGSEHTSSDTITYDAMGRPLSYTYADNGQSLFVIEYAHIYDLEQRVTYTVENLNEHGQNEWHYQYDDAGRLASLSVTQSPMYGEHTQTTVQYQYDEMGQVVAETQTGAPIRADLSPYSWDAQFTGAHVAYQRFDNVTYKSTQLLGDSGVVGEELILFHIIEVTDLNGRVLHFEMIDATGDQVALFTHQINEQGEITTRDSFNVYHGLTLLGADEVTPKTFVGTHHDLSAEVSLTATTTSIVCE